MTGKRAKMLALIGLLGTAAGAAGSDYAQWSLTLPEARRGFWQDADGDGVANGIEYVAGTDPLSAAHPNAPALRLGLTQEQGERQPRLEMGLPGSQPPDVVQQLEVSSDLRTWVPLANRFGNGPWVSQRGTLGPSAAGGATALRWTGEGLPQGGPNLFYRFSAELLQDADTDGDGLRDQWERQYGLDPAVCDADADPDCDGLCNLEEQQACTHPCMADTDGDGVYDGRQLAAGLPWVGTAIPGSHAGLVVLSP